MSLNRTFARQVHLPRRRLLHSSAALAAVAVAPGLGRLAIAQDRSLVFWQYKDPPGSAAMTYYAEAAGRFRDKTGVSVTTEFRSAEGIEQAVAAAANARSGFDALLWWGGPTARNQASLGNIIALDEHFPDDLWAHRQGAATMRYEGRQFGMPFDVSPWFLVYNKSVLADAGLSADAFPAPTDAPIGWDDFLAICGRIKADAGIAPLAWANQQGYFNEWYFYNFQAQSFDDPDDIVAINLGEASWQDDRIFAALEAYKELHDEGYFVEGGEVVPYEQHVRQLASGQAAMSVYFDFGGATAAMIDVFGADNIGFTKVPAYRADTRLHDHVCQEPNALYVASFAADEKGALLWLDHLASVEEMNEYARLTQSGPADDRWDLEMIENPAMRAIYEAAGDKGTPYPYNFVTQAQYTSLLEDGLLYLRGDMSAEELTSKWDEVDEDYKRQQG